MRVPTPKILLHVRPKDKPLEKKLKSFMSSDGALYVMEKPFEDQEIMMVSDLYKTLT